ncbi:c-type cytochrome [Rhizorhabdus dicambivorans]|uniref:Cytochrome C n=1 Tax=Rhizorhabdus dicambivorans TaxID=1850238 RepID=A0A2A4FWW7_9SPHN|nr:cytochrome c [Rhizorhabdus dicambivorans]ATE66939.1 cytochrome C [Rhizorhabdus dicambivorans]PCE42188.1 cytochrome C [Rhizorhabdus dicambivorans]
MRRMIALALIVLTPSPILAQPGPDPAKIYAENCARCHQLSGKGLEGAYPGLAGDRITTGPAPAAIRLVLDGKGEMPAFRNRLSDAEMAAALSYARTSWGNMAGAVTGQEVTKAKAAAK